MSTSNFDWTVVDSLSSTETGEITDTKRMKEFLSTFVSTDPASLGQAKSLSKLFFVLQTAITYLTGLIKRYQREKAEILETLEASENCQSCPTCEKRFRSFKYLDKHFEKCHENLRDHWHALRTNTGEARRYTLIKGDTLIIKPGDSPQKYVPTDLEVIEAPPIKRGRVRHRRNSERSPTPLKTYGDGLVFMTSDKASERMEEQKLKKMTDLATYHLVRDMQKLTRGYVQKQAETSEDTQEEVSQRSPKSPRSPPSPKSPRSPPSPKSSRSQSPKSPRSQSPKPKSPKSPRTPPEEEPPQMEPPVEGEVRELSEFQLSEAEVEEPKAEKKKVERDEITNSELEKLFQPSEVGEKVEVPVEKPRRRRRRSRTKKAITEETLNEIEKDVQQPSVPSVEDEEKKEPQKPTLVFHLKPQKRKISDDEVPVPRKSKPKRQIRKEDTFHDLGSSEMVDPFLIGTSSMMDPPQPPQSRFAGVTITNSELNILMQSSTDDDPT